MRLPIIFAVTMLTATSSVAERPRAVRAQVNEPSSVPTIKSAAPRLHCETPARLARSNDGNLITRSDKPVPANAYQAMYQTVDGCAVPAIYRRDVNLGNGTARPLP